MIKPLLNMRVLFLRSNEDVEELSKTISELGGQPVHVELIRKEPPTDWSALDHALMKVDSYDWIVFTSRTGVRALVQRARDVRVDLGRMRGRIAAVGPSTAEAVEKYGLKVAFIPSRYLTNILAEQLPDVSGKEILLVRSEGVDDSMTRILKSRGASVEQVPAYRVILVDYQPHLPQFDAVILTSPSTALALVKALETHSGHLGDDVIVCCIGPVTAKAAEALGIRVNLVAERHTVGGAIESLVRRLSPC